MARRPKRPLPHLRPGIFDQVSIVIAADSPEAMIDRIGQWCDADTGLLSRAQPTGAEGVSHRLAIHLEPGRDAERPRFIAVLTPTNAVLKGKA